MYVLVRAKLVTFTDRQLTSTCQSDIVRQKLEQREVPLSMNLFDLGSLEVSRLTWLSIYSVNYLG